jgi:hypothetical protein
MGRFGRRKCGGTVIVLPAIRLIHPTSQLLTFTHVGASSLREEETCSAVRITPCFSHDTCHIQSLLSYLVSDTRVLHFPVYRSSN